MSFLHLKSVKSKKERKNHLNFYPQIIKLNIRYVACVC